MSVRLSDDQLEQVVGRLLQVGVLLAAVVAAVGGVVLLWRHAGDPASYATFRGEPERLRTIGGILRGAAQWRGDAIVQLGLVLLIATPVARVAFTLVAFVIQRDRMYIAITAVVLALLLYGLLFATSAGG